MSRFTCLAEFRTMARFSVSLGIVSVHMKHLLIQPRSQVKVECIVREEFIDCKVVI